ncbi:MAG: hypothetical protein KDC79_00265 [Cyclobacteriaceae bacterium]|nr:hypothetical protein [Cyclobacteriaceae bacterium]
MNKTTKTFLLLILTILTQQTFDRLFGDYFIVGASPIFLFGIIWNFYNGENLYSHFTNKNDFNLAKFKMLSFLSIAWLFLYIIFLNIYAYPLERTDPVERMFFYQISAVSLVLPLYSLYYNVRFVATLLSGQNKQISKLNIVSSIIFFPIGIIWLQPKIKDVLQN